MTELKRRLLNSRDPDRSVGNDLHLPSPYDFHQVVYPPNGWTSYAALASTRSPLRKKRHKNAKHSSPFQFHLPPSWNKKQQFYKVDSQLYDTSPAPGSEARGEPIAIYWAQFDSVLDY
uniref:SFRICE_015160 n=1 Tax=Spodoptera frugiperda TaxID=7108 RepID=A0A2H1VSU4_SPOFR